MTIQSLSAAQTIAQLDAFGAVIDARSPGEFAEDHLPGAVNWPVLDDAERKLVGTEYKQVSAFEAKKRGAALVAKNIAAHIERHVMQQPKGWQPLVYCWRGGKRSGSMAWFLDQMGFRTHVLEGGYKAFRAAVMSELETLPARFAFNVVCGKTGSGKTRLLGALREAGAQVLDLEDLASHRGSVRGIVPGRPQPSQRAFETAVWDGLRRFDPARPVFIESESKKVGNVAVPEGLIAAMRASPCLQLDLPEDERVALLLEDYDFFVKDIEFFCDRLGALTQARGKETVADWQQRSRSGDVAAVVRELLVTHYDPVYLQSMRRNFTQYASAPVIAPQGRSVAAMTALARQRRAGSTGISLTV